jgi:hypothetical protein
VLAILAVVKCVKIMRREATSALCVAPLLAVSLVWLLSLPAQMFPGFMGLRIGLWVDAGMILGLLVTIVLGAVGLFLYNRGRFVQGRKQAAWGILLGTILVVLRTNAVVNVISSRDFAPTMEAERTSHTDDHSAEAEEFPDLNFKVTPPGGSWGKLKDPKSINPNATMIFRRGYPLSLAVLIAEPLELSNDSLLSMLKASLAGRFSEVSFTDEKTVTVNGIEWKSFSAEAPRKGLQPAEFSRFWAAGYAGHSYQWIVSMAAQERNDMEATGLKLLSGFHVIDSTKRVKGPDGVVDATMEADGFKVNLSAVGWLPLKSGDVSTLGSSISAMHPSASFFLADTMPIGGMDVATEDIARVFFANYGALDANAAGIKLEKITLRGADDAVQFSTEFAMDKQGWR